MLDPDRAEGEALARVCVEKLGGYLRDEGGDQNRKLASHSTLPLLTYSALHRLVGHGQDHADTSADGSRVPRGDYAESGRLGCIYPDASVGTRDLHGQSRFHVSGSYPADSKGGP